MLIRASQDIAPNTELEFSYIVIPAENHDYHKVQKELRHWEFLCECTLCVDAKFTPGDVIRKREMLFGALDCTLGEERTDVVQTERLMLQLEETYNDEGNSRNVPRTGAWKHYFLLAIHYAKVLAQPHKVIRATIKALEMLGFEIEDGEVIPELSEKSVLKVTNWGKVVDEVFDCLIMVWTAFALLGEGERADQARELAVVAYHIVVGEDETFEGSCGREGECCVQGKRLWKSVAY